MHAEALRMAIEPRLMWIPLLPLLSFALLILAGRRLKALACWISVAALAGAAALTFLIAPPVFDGAVLSLRWQWLSGTNPVWSIGLAVDGLSWVMLLVVTVIGTMIQLYSIGYMHGDPRFSRFFAYLSLFCASMLGLVLADHFQLLFMCWEQVGVCSNQLISFRF
jgi:NADH-quinone oxidoreductase subunit L